MCIVDFNFLLIVTGAPPGGGGRGGKLQTESKPVEIERERDLVTVSGTNKSVAMS